jgi:hypothetical protein
MNSDIEWSSVALSRFSFGVLGEASDHFWRCFCHASHRKSRLRIVFNGKLHGLGGGGVNQQLSESQRHVDTRRHTCGSDDPLRQKWMNTRLNADLRSR